MTSNSQILLQMTCIQYTHVYIYTMINKLLQLRTVTRRLPQVHQLPPRRPFVFVWLSNEIPTVSPFAFTTHNGFNIAGDTSRRRPLQIVVIHLSLSTICLGEGYRQFDNLYPIYSSFNIVCKLYVYIHTVNKYKYIYIRIEAVYTYTAYICKCYG